MIAVTTLADWLKSLPNSSSVAVDDGGLTLVEIDKNGKQTDAYWEVGGVPLPEDVAADEAEEKAAKAAPKKRRKATRK